MSFVNFLADERKKSTDLEKFDSTSVIFLDQYYSIENKFTDAELSESFKRQLYPVDAARVLNNQDDFCSQCKDVALFVNSDDSSLYCRVCGLVVPFMNCSSSNIAYGEEVDYSSFSYQRINHLREWLKTFQARESTPVSDKDMNRIMEILYKWNIRDVSRISYELVKKAQKHLKLKGCHRMQVWCRLTGRKPLILSPEAEEKIKIMFNKIQKPFDKHCPTERQNFLSYPYVLFKFCQLLDYDDLLNYFYLLKGKDKLQKQEEIFEKICQELGWKFIPLDVEVEPSQRIFEKNKKIRIT